MKRFAIIIPAAIAANAALSAGILHPALFLTIAASLILASIS